MSESATPAEQATPVSAREARLVSVLSRARRRSQVIPTERWLFALGGGLVLAGIVLVVIGWVGTSRTVLVAGQIPYVVSGGLLGLGLIFLGGFLYFGYWLARVQGDERRLADRVERQTAVLAEALGRIEAALNGTSSSRNGGRRSGLVRTPGGSLVHLPTCSVVVGRDDLVSVSGGVDLAPCKICGPDVDDLAVKA